MKQIERRAMLAVAVAVGLLYLWALARIMQ